MFKLTRIKKLLIAVSCVLFFANCQTKSKSGEIENEKENEVSPQVIKTDAVAYDLEHPDKRWILSDSLKEVSGIAWVGENKMMAIEDLRPILYRLKMTDTTGTITEKIVFKETRKEKYDIEDLALVEGTVYALYSHGKLFKI